MKSVPIEAVTDEMGEVVITRHQYGNMVEPLINELIKTRRGKACVLTNTNDEALQIVCMLNDKGVRAKLIQSVDRFRLFDKDDRKGVEQPRDLRFVMGKRKAENKGHLRTKRLP